MMRDRVSPLRRIAHRIARALSAPAGRARPASGLITAIALAALSAPALAEARPLAPEPKPQLAQAETPDFPPLLDDELEEELNEATREAIERFLALLGPMIDRFSAMIGDLPRYEAPIILPNGDILIRRKRDPIDIAPEPKTDGASPTIDL